MNACDICGSPIPPRPAGKRGPLPRVCSAECKTERHRLLDSARRARLPKAPPPSLTATCRICGEDFAARSPLSAVCYTDVCQRAKTAERSRAFQRRFREEHGKTYAATDRKSVV